MALSVPKKCKLFIKKEEVNNNTVIKIKKKVFIIKKYKIVVDILFSYPPTNNQVTQMVHITTTFLKNQVAITRYVSSYLRLTVKTSLGFLLLHSNLQKINYQTNK